MFAPRQLDATGQLAVSAQVTLAFEDPQVVVHNRRRANPDRCTDLAHRRWSASFADVFGDEFQHALLAIAELAHSRLLLEWSCAPCLERMFSQGMIRGPVQRVKG